LFCHFHQSLTVMTEILVAGGKYIVS